jgi:serine/threonine protein kinase
LGRYVIGKKLGQGGEGLIFSAEDPLLRRSVAIKVVRSENEDARQADLLAEARLLASLDHPNVLRVFDVGTHGDEVWIATALAQGGHLREHLDRREGIDWRGLAQLFVQAARGLEAAHAAGVVHRDVKPENLLISADGRVLVSDFGLASPTASPSSNEAVGTPAYWAPEVERGDANDERSDQYAFAASLSVLLRRYCPKDELPDDLHELLEGAMRNEASQRWADMAEVRSRLEAIAFRNIKVPGASAAWPTGTDALSRGTPDSGRAKMRIDDLIEIASSTRELSEFRGEALRWLNRYVGFDTVLMGNVELEGDFAPHIEGFSAEFVELFKENAHRYAPTLARVIGQSLADDKTMRDTDIFSRRTRARTPFYTEIIGPKGSRYMAIGALRVGGKLVGSLQISRTSESTPYSDRELARIDRALKILAMGEQLHGPRPRSDEEILPPQSEARTGAMERAVAELQRLGLSTLEIAETCGLTPRQVTVILR